MQTEHLASSQSFLSKALEHFLEYNSPEIPWRREVNEYGVGLNCRKAVLHRPLLPFAICKLHLETIMQNQKNLSVEVISSPIYKGKTDQYSVCFSNFLKQMVT